MKLFSDTSEPTNILPFDGECIYYGPIFDLVTANNYFDRLMVETPWKNDEVNLFGKNIITARKVAWYGNKNFFYSYSNAGKIAREWTTDLLEIKEMVESISDVKYNSCLLNLYENGDQGLGWHSDDEEMGKNANIASVSFGAERRFDLRHKGSKETVHQVLDHGSLLIMKGATQTFWKHQLPKARKVREPRVNLTFRRMISQ